MPQAMGCFGYCSGRTCGHIDGRNESITDYPAIMECLVRMPSIEPRALNLFVKEDKRIQFEREFVKEFGKDFILLTKEDVYKAKLFGEGKPHKNVDEMIKNVRRNKFHKEVESLLQKQKKLESSLSQNVLDEDRMKEVELEIMKISLKIVDIQRSLKSL